MATNVKSASVSTVILALVRLCFSPVSLKTMLPQIIRKSFLTHCTILGPAQGKFGWPFLLLFRISCVFGIIFLNIITLDGIILAEKEKLKTRILAHSALSNWASVTKVSWGRFFFRIGSQFGKQWRKKKAAPYLQKHRNMVSMAISYTSKNKTETAYANTTII